MRGLLPPGSDVAIACGADALGGRLFGATPHAPAWLTLLVRRCLAETVPAPAQALLHVLKTADGACVAMAARLQHPFSKPLLSGAQRAAWCEMAAAFGLALLETERMRARIEGLEKSKQLQQALYEIADLAGADLEMGQMLQHVHSVLDSLMYAEKCYIVEYDEEQQSMRFLYFSDRHDDFVADPETLYFQRDMPNSLTFALLRHGQAVRGPSPQVRDRLRVDYDALHGPDSKDWLGVTMLREGRVCGAIVVQSYTTQVRFTEYDQRLLTFVAHNVGGGLARQQRAQERVQLAHAELEQRVAERTRELAEVNQQLLAQIAERWRAEQRLTHQPLHDALTGLPNCSHLLDRLGEAIHRARNGDGMSFAVLFLDLDRFKLVNDSIGHAAGDGMLVEVAKRIVFTIRSDDVVARLGGDEFAILVRCEDGMEGVRELAQRLLGVLGQPMWVAGRELFPSGSLGIAAWHPRYSSGEELLRDADAAMYRTKAQTQDRCAVFDEAMRDAALRSLDLEADLRRAINSGAFEPFYQPIVRLRDGQVAGHEALLRWRHESRGLLVPSQFIDLGQDGGLIE